MDYVISYEVMSIVILALILVSYTCHKWLDIKRNRTFNLLVIMTICTVIVDLIGRSCVYVVGSNALFMATVVATVVNLSLYQVCLLFYKYTLNTLGCANVFYQGISAVFLVFDLLVDIALLSNPWTHFFFEYNGLHKGQYQIHYGMVVLLICAEILMLEIQNLLKTALMALCGQISTTATLCAAVKKAVLNRHTLCFG